MIVYDVIVCRGDTEIVYARFLCMRVGGVQNLSTGSTNISYSQLYELSRVIYSETLYGYLTYSLVTILF